MEETTYGTLCVIRERVLELTRVKESMSKMEAVYKSPSVDRMPGGGDGDAMGRRMCALEEMDERKRTLEGEVRELLETIRPMIRELPNNLHTFCVAFYLAGSSIRDICMVMNRSKATVMEYKKELREWVEKIDTQSDLN